jgi:acetyl-CoA carboxylase alpha subunit
LADPLFILAEDQAYDHSRSRTSRHRRPRSGIPLSGILSSSAVRQQVRALARLDVDGYVAAAVHPSEDPNRPGIRWLVRHLEAQLFDELEMGPLYAAELVLTFDGSPRRIGLLGQDRRRRNGVWRPEHHLRAVDIIRSFASRALPIVTFIDTPGADAGESANRQNQAQSISRLIAEFAQLHVPTVGVILGNGYSGGAIPLATTNLLLSVRDGVFNTIQPRGLAGIARKYDLSWQESARYVGVRG